MKWIFQRTRYLSVQIYNFNFKKYQNYKIYQTFSKRKLFPENIINEISDYSQKCLREIFSNNVLGKKFRGINVLVCIINKNTYKH